MGVLAGLRAVSASAAERREPMPGDDLVPDAVVVMDRAFTLTEPPGVVWPWVEQLGKRRAGWYLPRSVERVVPAGRRAIRRVEERWLGLAVGDVIPDYGGRNETFEVALVEPPSTLVYTSRRGHTDVSWAIALTPTRPGGTRVRLRLRLAGVRHPRLMGTLGEAVDVLTIAGMAAGLRERLAERRP